MLQHSNINNMMGKYTKIDHISIDNRRHSNKDDTRFLEQLTATIIWWF